MAITARNYAAHALKAAQELLNDGLVTGTAKKVAEDISTLIPRAQHFAIQDGGKILNDGLKGLVGLEFRLPYEGVTVECFCDSAKYCVLAGQSKDSNDIVFFYSGCAKGCEWKILPIVGIFKCIDALGVHMQLISPNEEDEIPYYVQFLSETVLELCEALSCKNVSHEPIERIDPAVNARRVRAGKLPLFETRQLVIDAGKPSRDSGQRGGTHASPRQHLRRGHIRRLPSGNVWVNSCVVGNRANGIIEKSYAVKATK